MSDVETSHHPEAHRYEAHLDGRLAGFAEYELSDEQVVFTHAEVDSAFEGLGVGSTLARFALDDVRGGGRQVVAKCPFIAGWIDRHPDYADLLEPR